MITADAAPTPHRRAILTALIANTVWINASEVFRYFLFVMPMMRAAFPEVPDIAPMSVSVFLVWGVWDAVLIAVATGAAWLAFDRYGEGWRVALAAGAAVWLAVFVILWLGLYNMNLATPGILAVALPLALVEMVVAAFLVLWARRRAA